MTHSLKGINSRCTTTTPARPIIFNAPNLPSTIPQHHYSRVSSTSMTVGTDAVGPMGAGSNGLEQGRSNLARHSLYELANSAAAADPLAIYRACLESQFMAQKAKIQAMNSQYAIPISDLDSNPFQLPSLPPMPPVANAESTITAKATINGCSVPAAPAPTPAAPRLQPAQPVPGS
ncbi:hypothetical protein BC826DRAFT_545314 [Russula brevipes]|nr:hypothetical protein BC826DRAFT_545314 [Russula brevipes]